MNQNPAPKTPVFLLDTTLRDGEQTQGVSFSPAEKINLAKALLQKLKVDRIEIASARVSEGEKDAVRNIATWAEEQGFLEQIEVLGFVDHRKSVDWVLESGVKKLNLLAKGSKKHCHLQLKKTIQEHLRDIQRTLDYAHSQKLEVNIYLEDWSNGYKDSPEYVTEFMRALEHSGIQHFMLPDTLGVMTPDEVFQNLSAMRDAFPWAMFDFHPHNDYGLATANVLAAIKAGITHIHCTLNCLGERAGNASLAEIAVLLKDKFEVQLSIDEAHLGTLSEMVENFSGKRLAGNAPIVGRDVFTQTSGIHADGDKKANLYHTQIQPERFGRTRSYALGKMSGKASLEKNLESLGLELSEANRNKVLKRIIELGDSKAAITMADLPFIVTDVLEHTDSNPIHLLNCSITSGFKLISVASICVQFEDREYFETGQGNGGYDAFMTAMRQILKQEKIEPPILLDYEVRIPHGGHTSALTEALITWQVGNQNIQTIGVDSDQLMAAVNATLKVLNLQCLQSQ